MDKRIAFARSADGTRVACSIQGSGFPLMTLSLPLASNCTLRPVEDAEVRFIERMAQRRTYILTDLRGCGAADWHPAAHSFDDYLNDILALADAADLAQVDLMGGVERAAVAIRFAAKHPSRVRRLILGAVTLGPTAISGWPLHSSAMLSMLREDFGLFLETVASRMWGGEANLAAKTARMRECVDQASLLAAHQAGAAVNVSDDASLIQHPTLLWEVDDNSLVAAGDAERFAAAAGPLVELRVVPHRPNMDWLDDGAEIIERFDAEQDARLNPEFRAHREHPSDLSGREMEVLKLIAAGLSNGEIAGRLVLSPATVATHVRHVLEKTACPNRAAAAAWALRNGLA